MTSAGPVRVKRLTRPVATAVVTGLVLLAIIGAFFLGRLVTSPAQKALQEAPASVQAYAQVEKRSVSTAEPITGTLSKGESTPVVVAESTGQSVVTDMPLDVGSTVRPLQYLGTVGTQPFFAMSSDVPLFRDLKLKDKGNDVVILQRFLAANGFPGVGATGVMDDVTLEAIRLVYTNQGLTPPGTTAANTVFRYRDFPRFGAGSGKVSKTTPVASTVSEKSPLVTIALGETVVKAHVTLPTADELKSGSSVDLTAGDKTVKGTVTSVGEFGPDKDGVQGRDITFTPQGSLSGTVVTVTPKGTAPAAPAVPLIALREENGQQYVLAAASKTDQPRRINITVTRQADGWAAIVEDKDLPEGAVLWIP